jgi:hypothetical protein
MSQRVIPTSDSGPELLGIYLNDHLAGSIGGLALARRISDSHSGGAAANELHQLADEIAEDRAALVDIMDTLGVPKRAYKGALAFAAERLGRFKLNGRVLGRSPLSSLVELEALQIGVEGKSACWRSLRLLAETDDRLNATELDGLIERAGKQTHLLEEIRLRVVAEALQTGHGIDRGKNAADQEPAAQA